MLYGLPSPQADDPMDISPTHANGVDEEQHIADSNVSKVYTLHVYTRCRSTLCIAHALVFDTVQYQSIIAYTLNRYYSDVHINLTDTAHK
jgi:hypothetical protein